MQMMLEQNAINPPLGSSSPRTLFIPEAGGSTPIRNVSNYSSSQILTAALIKIQVVSVAKPYRLFDSENGGTISLQNVGNYLTVITTYCPPTSCENLTSRM
jgi:hypothetical protein